MASDLQVIRSRLPDYRDAVRELNEILLANLVMISETPAPTFQEDRRVEFLLDRFNEYELQNCSTDEAGNALAILPGTDGGRNILVEAHLDTVYTGAVDHTVQISPEYATGVGIGDNSLGAAAVATLPLILEKLGIRLRSNLLLMGSVKSLGRGDIEGIRFFLANRDVPVDYGICVEGVRLGRLSYASIGMIRGEIDFEVPDEYDWSRFGAGGAIVNINEVVNRILEIPLPRRPRTTIALNSLESGGSFNTIPTKARLQFEIRSESARMVTRLGNEIGDIAAEISSQTGADVAYRILARREPGGIKFSDSLSLASREIIAALGITPRISPSTSELSAFIGAGIPAVTIGLTNGEHVNEPDERIELAPISSGLAQLIGLLIAVDGTRDERPLGETDD